MADEGKTPGYDAFTPTPGLQPGDVEIGDLVRFRSGFELIEGRVATVASGGGVIGVYAGAERRAYNAALLHIELVAKGDRIDVLEAHVARLSAGLERAQKIINRINSRSI